MSDVEVDVDAVEDAEDTEPAFTAEVQALINSGRIVLSEEDVKVGADSNPSGVELLGKYTKLSGDMAAALEFLKGDAKKAGAYLWDKINTIRKNSARQKLYNDAIPAEDKMYLSMARKAVKGGAPGFAGLSDAEAVELLKSKFTV